MTQLPSLSEPNFDQRNFINTWFQVWPQNDNNRDGEPFLTVIVGRYRQYDGVIELLRKHHANFGCLITAWNPGSQQTSVKDNEAANLKLLELVNAAGLAVYPARGTSMENNGEWFEDSFLVLGSNYDQFVEWQQAFGQLAFVIFRSDGIVELRW